MSHFLILLVVRTKFISTEEAQEDYHANNNKIARIGK